VRKAFKNIILLTIGFIFLVSATGVYLTIHYCTSEDSASLFLFMLPAEVPCEHNDNSCTAENSHAEACDDHQGCGHPSPEFPPCCSDALFYIAVDDDYFRAESPVTPVFNFILLPEASFDPLETAHITDVTNYDISQPPGSFSGKELVFFNRQLIL
jgi:hypothetical protein